MSEGLKSHMNVTYLINILVVDLHHGSVDACTKALYLAECEKTVFRGTTHFDLRVILDRLDDVIGTTQLARGCAAHLQVILAHLGAVEHCVE